MKKILIFYLFIFNTVGYSQDKGKIIDDFATKGKELWQIPGMSVVVVENDSTIFLEKVTPALNSFAVNFSPVPSCCAIVVTSISPYPI